MLSFADGLLAIATILLLLARLLRRRTAMHILAGGAFAACFAGAVAIHVNTGWRAVHGDKQAVLSLVPESLLYRRDR